MTRTGRRSLAAAAALACAVVLAGCAPAAEEAEPEETEEAVEEVAELAPPTTEQLAAAVLTGDALADYGWVFQGSEPVGAPDGDYGDGSCIKATLTAVENTGPDGYPEYGGQVTSFTRGAADTLSIDVRHYPEADPVEVLESFTALTECAPETLETTYGATTLSYTPADPAPPAIGDATTGVVAHVEYADLPEYGVIMQSNTLVACGDLLIVLSGSTGTAPLAAADVTPAIERALAAAQQVIPDRC